MLTQKTPKNIMNFICEKCDFKCSKQSEWKRHILTSKHLNVDKCLQKKRQNETVKIHKCECGKEYGYRQSLHTHKKICNKFCPNPEEEEEDQTIFLKQYDKKSNELTILTNLVLEVVKSNSELLKQNGEFQKQNIELNKQVLDVYQKIQPMTINNNSHNKTFNLQFFLNEQCKDAMNIMDFVDSFTLQLSDLEDVSKQGYIDGISNIIVKKLNEMDVHKRPIHCSDAKREIMYVKDQNKWEKEEPSYARLRKAIKYISKKNSDLLGQWSEAHPASKNITSQTNTDYMQMIMQAMGGRGEIIDNENKIIRKIAKTVLIEK
jgi:hypothetical protein